MSLCMRKPTICICENKDADQLCCNCTADQCLCFRYTDYTDSTTPHRFMSKLYTEQKKKRNNRPPRIFEFKGKTLIISGLLVYDSHSWDMRVYHAKN